MFCWFFRFKISDAMDGDGVLSRAVEKHIRRCADCREFYNGCVLLADGLRGKAAVSNDGTSRRLSKRVLRVVPYRQTAVRKVSIRLWPVAAAACIALVVLAGVLFLAKYQREQIGREGVPGTEIQVVRSLVGGDFAGAWSGVVERPLAEEMEKLEGNTESAVRFLVTCVAVNVAGSGVNQQLE